MYKNNQICIVIPAYNEATQIAKVIDTLPTYVDAVVVVNDASTDDTKDVVQDCQRRNSKLHLINHERNLGCGGALVSGYKWALENPIDIVVRMDGDGQMDPTELHRLLDPIVNDQADYAKGNRFFSGNAYKKMPRVRFYGTAFLSLLTKIVSGYWHISDFQSGYCAINKKALATVDWDMMYPGYGQPNDLLILLNIHHFRVADIPIEPIYNVGEVSGINIPKVMGSLGWLLVRRFFWRLKEKYIVRDFHPLVFFYGFGLIMGNVSALLFIRVFFMWYLNGRIPAINALAAFSSFLAAVQFSLFAMWFDMEANKDLKKSDLPAKVSDPREPA